MSLTAELESHTPRCNVDVPFKDCFQGDDNPSQLLASKHDIYNNHMQPINICWYISKQKRK